MAGPQRGATEDAKRSWIASPGAARAVRVLVFLVPALSAWLAVKLLAGFFYQPDGWTGLAVWGVQALVVGGIGATIVDRYTRRALPLATLMGMSLTFPDQAPNRFSVAMRTGTVRQMKKRLDELAENGLAEDTQKAAEQAIELVTLLGRHERLTRGHTERVRAYADVIAGEMRLPEHDRQMLAWGVLLHDIGKLSVPPEILNKNGRPTDEEWAILQTHPAEGARILEPLTPWLGDWALAASEHHERWDGNGYPKGLSGREISLAGRITAVADAYDVITSRRSYKAPMSTQSARQELVRCSKTQFDPAVVRAMIGASVDEKRSASRLLSWLPEVPGLAAASNAVALVPPALVATALATTGAVAAAPSRPDVLQTVDDVDVTTISTDSDTSPTTSSTGSGEPATVSEPAITGPPQDPSNGRTSTTVPPTIELPTTLPEVTLPNPTVPGVSLPGVSLPGVSIPLISLPGVSLPGVTTPDLTLPLDGSDLNVPAGEFTGGLVPDVTVPTRDLLGGPPDPEPGSTTSTTEPVITIPDLGLFG